MREQSTITAATNGMHVGDTVFTTFTTPRSLARQALRLITVPRVHYVANIDTETTCTISTRRITWDEWRYSWALLGREAACLLGHTRLGRWWRLGVQRCTSLWQSVAGFCARQINK